jgi:hypothetical protein
VSAVADVLNAAADLIERDGWVQGRYQGPCGEHCMTDALIAACQVKEEKGEEASAWWRLYGRAADALETGLGTRALPGWNDAPGRTQAEVVAALRAAAERAA